MPESVNPQPATNNLPFYDTDHFNPPSAPIKFSGAARPRAPDGVYNAKFVGHRTFTYYGPRTEFIFELLPSKDGNDVIGRFGMLMPVRHLIGPEGPDGMFEAKGPRSNLVKLLKACQVVIGTTEAISIRDLLPLSWEVTLVSPLTDDAGLPIPEEDRYSIIKRAVPGSPVDW